MTQSFATQHFSVTLYPYHCLIVLQQHIAIQRIPLSFYKQLIVNYSQKCIGQTKNFRFYRTLSINLLFVRVARKHTSLKSRTSSSLALEVITTSERRINEIIHFTIIIHSKIQQQIHRTSNIAHQTSKLPIILHRTTIDSTSQESCY